MFDTNKEFAVKIASGGIKTAIMKWPSDADWCARTAQQRIVRRAVGRGQTTTEATGGVSANADLFAKYRVDQDGAPFDEAEAAAVIAKMERCGVLDVQRNGDVFAIRMQVAGGIVVHNLRIPKQSDILKYERSLVSSTQGRRESIQTVSLEASGVLWDAVQTSVEGYAPGSNTPIVHKDVAVMELLAAIEAEAEDSDPEFAGPTGQTGRA